MNMYFFYLDHKSTYEIESIGWYQKLMFSFQSDKTCTLQNMQFTQDADTKKPKTKKDNKEEKLRHKRSQVISCGQQACAKLKEAFDILSSSLSIEVTTILQHLLYYVVSDWTFHSNLQL